MNRKFLSTSLLAVAITTMPALAEKVDIGDWGDASEGAAITYKVGDTIRRYEVFISHTATGRRNLYVRIGDFERTLCTPSELGNEGIARFQGQALQIYTWCHAYSDNSSHYIEFTPKTQAGDKYLYDLFKSSKGSITVKYRDDEFDLSVVGFTREWEAFGGDAL